MLAWEKIPQPERRKTNGEENTFPPRLGNKEKIGDQGFLAKSILNFSIATFAAHCPSDPDASIMVLSSAHEFGMPPPFESIFL